MFGSSLVSAVGRAVSESLSGWADRQARQRRLKRASKFDLLLALLATRLSAAAYESSQAALAQKLNAPAIKADIPGGLEVLHFRRDQGSDVHPQWYLARGALPVCVGGDEQRHSRGDEAGAAAAAAAAGKALYVVFRGTWSNADILRDLCVEPERHHHLGHFHGGFLKGVRDDPDLVIHLKRALREGCSHLFLFGHSLGGSLALTLAAARLVPDEDYRGPVTVVAVGAPPVICAEKPRLQHAPPPSTAAGPGEEGKEAEGAKKGHHHEEAKGRGRGELAPTDAPTTEADESCHKLRRSRAQAARNLLVINDCDVVPRLLGSPMPVAVTAALAATAGNSASGAVMRRNVEIMETMQRYTHPRGTQGLLLRADGVAKAVASHDRSAVLHLHESLFSSQLFDDHSCERYVERLEMAAALAEAFDEGDDGAETGNDG